MGLIGCKTYRQYHDASQIRTQPGFDRIRFEFHIHLPAKAIDVVCKVKAFNALRKLLSNPSALCQTKVLIATGKTHP